MHKLYSLSCYYSKIQYTFILLLAWKIVNYSIEFFYRNTIYTHVIQISKIRIGLSDLLSQKYSNRNRHVCFYIWMFWNFSSFHFCLLLTLQYKHWDFVSLVACNTMLFCYLLTTELLLNWSFLHKLLLST